MAKQASWFKAREAEILEEARNACSRDPVTNGISKNDFINEVQKRIDFDPIKEHRQKAERIVRDAEKPHKTKPNGTLWLPGFPHPSAYEPQQLISDDAGMIVDRDSATGHFIGAKLGRSAKNLSRVRAAFERDEAEARSFAEWNEDQELAGRPSNEITFGNFIRERGYWTEDIYAPEDDGEEDDDA